jgi:hypothetical protein
MFSRRVGSTVKPQTPKRKRSTFTKGRVSVIHLVSVLSPHPICLGHHPLSFRGTHLDLRCACDEQSACVRRVLAERTCCPAEAAMRLVRRERERVVVGGGGGACHPRM